METKKPAALDKTVEVNDGIKLAVAKVQSLKSIKSRLPGEISGPGIAIFLTVKNGSQKGLDLRNVVVTVAGSDGSPGDLMSSRPSDPFTESLSPDASAKGVYLFTLPTVKRDLVTVSVTLAANRPVVLFKGEAR